MNDTPQQNTGKSRREREYARHRQEILDTAQSLFASHGYFQTTMQMIADRVEFSVGYLYKHFSGKEEIYEEMVAYHMKRLDEMRHEAEALGLSPLEEIRHTFLLVCNHFNKHRDFMRIFHEGITGACNQLLEGKQRHHQEIAEKLKRAQDLGELKAYDVDLLTAAIQGATKELFAEMASREGDNPFDTLPDTLFKLLIDPLRN